MNHFGEIRRLSRICRPDIGVITSIAPCHLEGVGSIEGVVRAKAEILENIPSGGTVILNQDDPHLVQLGNKTDTNVLFFGESREADIRAHSIHETGEEIRFTLQLPDSQAWSGCVRPVASWFPTPWQRPRQAIWQAFQARRSKLAFYVFDRSPAG